MSSTGTSRAPLLLITPAFAVVFVLAAYSLFWLIQLSLTDLTFGQPFDQGVPIGLENFRWLLFDPSSTFWPAARLTGIYVLGTLVPELVLGLGIALLLNRQMRLRSVYTAALIIPIVLMPAMVGMIARLYFSHDGLINYGIETLAGVKLNWGGRELALLAVILVDIWEWTPFFILILLAGLQTLPVEAYEAARVDGASNWQAFRHITLPMLLPLILTALVLRFMDVLRIFDVIFAMFGGGPGTATTTLPLYIYRTTMLAEDVGRGSAASVMLIVMIVASTLLLVRLRQRVMFQA
ncbi:MAG: carbohydrate ABC transporter permease [Geminicoccaceae bacterium]